MAMVGLHDKGQNMAFGLRKLVIAAAAAIALAVPANALASGGSYVFDGGTPAEQTQVRGALDASSFDWNIVPATVTIHITREATTEAAPGEIWVDAALLDSGRFSWGVVQHEYAHQVDFFLFNDQIRAELLKQLGGKDWCNSSVAGLSHAAYGCEQFASALAWAYWPTADNCMEPKSKNDEGGRLQPAQFRALLTSLLQRPLVRTLQTLKRR
jgi:hypothetical protein